MYFVFYLLIFCKFLLLYFLQISFVVSGMCFSSNKGFKKNKKTPAMFKITHCRSCKCAVVSTFHSQVVILHHMLSKATVRARPTVLWCYKKELGFSRYAPFLCIKTSLLQLQNYDAPIFPWVPRPSCSKPC